MQQWIQKCFQNCLLTQLPSKKLYVSKVKLVFALLAATDKDQAAWEEDSHWNELSHQNFAFLNGSQTILKICFFHEGFSPSVYYFLAKFYSIMWSADSQLMTT